MNIIGTSPESIDLAEDRKHFNKLLEELQIPQAAGVMATSLEEAIEGAKRVGYPVVVRPSYVLGGRAMVIAYDEESVVRYMKEAVEYSHDRPVLIDHFLEDAIEVDVDALSDGEDVVIGGIMQHIEEAGIHSGDSSCVLPAVDIPQPLMERMRDYTFKLARALKVDRADEYSVRHPAREWRLRATAQKGGKVYVLEVNPRASRTVPYVSKATGVPMAKIAARLMTGRKLREFLPENIERRSDLDTGSCYYVKSPVFPWNKFPGVDTVLGPEMKSTGEVMGVGDNFGEAFGKAQLGRRTKAADAGHGLHQRHRPRQALRRRSRPQVCRHGIQTRRDLRHRRRDRSRGNESRARLQSKRRTSERGRLHQRPAHSSHRQHAHRARAVVRREGDPARCRDWRAFPRSPRSPRRARLPRESRRCSAAK